MMIKFQQKLIVPVPSIEKPMIGIFGGPGIKLMVFAIAEYSELQ